MSLFIPFATGFLNTYTDVKRDQAQARIDKEAAESERTFEIGKLILQNADKLGGQDPAALASLLQSEDLPGLANLVTSMEDVASTQSYGAGPNPYRLNLVSEMEYGSGTSGYDRAEIFWQSWQNQLGDEKKYSETLEYFKNNKAAMDSLRTDVLKNEYELRMGNILRQKKQSDAGTPMPIEYLNLADNYGNAARLFDELGFQSIENDVFGEAAAKIQDLDTMFETAYWVNVKNRDNEGMIKQQAIRMDKKNAQILEQLATTAGFENAQEMIFSYNFDGTVVREAGQTDEQFAAAQNRMLFKVTEFEMKANIQGVSGYSAYLRSPGMWSKERSAKLLTDLVATFGNDKSQQIQALSLLSGTPSGLFSSARKYRYARQGDAGSVALVNGQELVEEITGLKQADFDEGLKAQQDAVTYLDRLLQLEQELGSEVGTGWVREFAAGFKAFGIQIQQGFTLIGNVFRDNEAVFAGADLQAIQAIAQKNGIDLGKVKEADAIRLTLAAKMARAVDPAGRLSNQDFEIQLARLGSTIFSTPESTRAALTLVKKEFENDLEYKQMLRTISSQRTPVTRQQGRRVQAAMTLRELQGQVYGTDRITAAPPTKEEGSGGLPEGSTPIEGVTTPDGQQVFIGPDDKLYLPDGTPYNPDTYQPTVQGNAA